MLRSGFPRPPQRHRGAPPITQDEIKELSLPEIQCLFQNSNIRLIDTEHAHDLVFDYYYRYRDVEDDGGEDVWSAEIKRELNSLIAKCNDFTSICKSAERIALDIDSPNTVIWRRKLKGDRCRLQPTAKLLVLGIAESGKSSFINVLTDADVIPVGRYPGLRQKPPIILRYSDAARVGGNDVDPGEITEAVVEESARLLEENGGRGTPRECEVGYPIPPFDDLVEFVEIPPNSTPLDAAEVEEEVLERRERLREHLRNATAVVILLMSQSPSRVLGPEAVSLIKEVKRAFGDGAAEVIFVFNFWDIRLEHDRDEAENELKPDYLQSLREHWKNVELNYNAFFTTLLPNLSVKLSDAVIIRGAVGSLLARALTAHHSRAFPKISKHLLSIQAKLSAQAGSVINKLIRSDNTSRHLKELLKRLPETEMVDDRLGQILDEEFVKLHTDLVKFMQSDDGLKELTNIMEDDLPEPYNHDSLESEMQKLFNIQMHKIVTAWNGKQDIRTMHVRQIVLNQLESRFADAPKQVKIQNFVTKIAERCMQQFDEFEKETKIIEWHFQSTAERNDDSSDEENPPKPFNNLEVIVLVTTSVVWLPLGVAGGLLSSPFIATKALVNYFFGKNEVRRYGNTLESRKAFLEGKFKEMFRKKASEFANDVLRPMYKFCDELKPKLRDLHKQNRERIKSLVTRCEERNEKRQEKLQKIQENVKELNECRRKLYHSYYNDIKCFESINENFFPKIWHSDFIDDDKAPRPIAVIRKHTNLKRDVAVIRGSINSKILTYELETSWKLLSYTNHSSILQFYGVVALDGSIGFVSDTWDMNFQNVLGTLRRISNTNRAVQSRKSESNELFDVTMNLTEQLLSAIDFVHNQNFVLRDFCPSLILYKGKYPDYQIKLFSFSSPHELMKDWYWSRECNTYGSPETVKHGICNYQSNVFTIGLILWELYYRKRFHAHFELNDDGTTSFHDDEGFYRSLLYPRDENMPEFYFSMLESCLRWEPKSRPHVRKILEHFRSGKSDFENHPFQQYSV